MSAVTCATCGRTWDASQVPLCPSCRAYTWEKTSGLIRPKHDPYQLPSAASDFRTVVTYEFVDDPAPYLSHLAESGSWYYHTRHKKWFTFLQHPLGVIGGSAIQPWAPMPFGPVDGLLIADAINKPHAFAEYPDKVWTQLNTHEIVPPAKCSIPDCYNLSVPGKDKCVAHSELKLAK